MKHLILPARVAGYALRYNDKTKRFEAGCRDFTATEAHKHWDWRAKYARYCESDCRLCAADHNRAILFTALIRAFETARRNGEVS